MPKEPVSEAQAYASSLAARIAKADNDLKSLHGGEHEREERLALIRSELGSEIASLNAEVKALEKDLGAAMQRTVMLVHAFRDSVRTPEYSRVRQRVEAWGGERLISREELKRLLREAR